jgi:homocitrate synthase NifV
VEFAKKEGVYVSVNAEDASRTDMDFLIQFAMEAKRAGADRLRYCDTVGIMEPFLVYHQIKELKKVANIDIEMHTHNDFGMATANALGGIKAGANWVGVTMNGLGERAGNAALEEVVMALKYIWDLDLGFKTDRLREVAEYVAQASGRSLPVCKTIVGSNMFKLESMIHGEAVIMKNPREYEAFSPEEVGLERQIVIGKHSDEKSLIIKFKEYGITLEEEEAREILPRIRTAAINLKRSLFDKEIVGIYNEWQKGHLNWKIAEEN